MLTHKKFIGSDSTSGDFIAIAQSISNQVNNLYKENGLSIEKKVVIDNAIITATALEKDVVSYKIIADDIKLISIGKNNNTGTFEVYVAVDEKSKFFKISNPFSTDINVFKTSFKDINNFKSITINLDSANIKYFLHKNRKVKQIYTHTYSNPSYAYGYSSVTSTLPTFCGINNSIDENLNGKPIFSFISSYVDNGSIYLKNHYSVDGGVTFNTKNIIKSGMTPNSTMYLCSSIFIGNNKLLLLNHTKKQDTTQIPIEPNFFYTNDYFDTYTEISTSSIFNPIITLIQNGIGRSLTNSEKDYVYGRICLNSNLNLLDNGKILFTFKVPGITSKHVAMSTSIDNGQTWSSPVILSDYDIQPNVVGKNSIFGLSQDLNNNFLWAFSDDGGNNFSFYNHIFNDINGFNLGGQLVSYKLFKPVTYVNGLVDVNSISLAASVYINSEYWLYISNFNNGNMYWTKHKKIIGGQSVFNEPFTLTVLHKNNPVFNNLYNNNGSILI